MPAEIVDETGREGRLEESAARAAGEILRSISRAACELCVLLVDDERIRELNREWRDKDAPTDVLSFPQLDAPASSMAAADTSADAAQAAVVMLGDAAQTAAVMLGDVVISVDTLRRQAEAGGWTEEEELARLILHGVLHLVGMDHEDPDDARVMRAEEARIVRVLAGRGIACAWEDRA